MGLSEEELELHAQRMLEMLGRSFQGIRLKCRGCGEHAMAHTVTLAEMFGWINVRHVKGNRYAGTCIECAKPAGAEALNLRPGQALDSLSE